MTCVEKIEEFIGTNDLIEHSNYFDFHQEIARSAFADMLHDWERNQKYYAALKITIDKLHSQGIEANVLDIGTGSGLLSMMAVKCGADTVVACEAFAPMADCAERVIESNKMSNKIKLIKKPSTKLTVGHGLDMEKRANVLVTELFDTELIGEGAIGTYKHAHQNLLEKECIVIPETATVFAQIVECPIALAWKNPKIFPNSDGDILLMTPKVILDCPGSSAVHDIQLSQLLKSNFNALSDPIPIFNFDWSGKTELMLERNTKSTVKALNNGVAQVVFMWWDIKMDVEGSINLSCAPYWAHPDKKSATTSKIPEQNMVPWRDHWMQGVYFLPKSDLYVNKDQDINLISCHDEYSMWFGLNEIPERPHCNCGFHIAYSRTRIGQINDSLRNKKYLSYFEKKIDQESTVLVVSDGSLLGLSVSAMGVKFVYVLESSQLSAACMTKYIQFNSIKNAKIITNLQEIEDTKKITLVIAEPNFSSSILPWDNFHFGKIFAEIESKLNENVEIIPSSATLKMLPVEFVDLYKICAPLKICEGFDLAKMDELIEKSSVLSDSNVEAQPLWEYPCFASGDPVYCLTVDFKNFANDVANSGKFQKESLSKCNGIAFWVDWNLDMLHSAKTTVSTGPLIPTTKNELVSWNMHFRQGVHFLKDIPTNWNIKFSPKFEKVYFDFE